VFRCASSTFNNQPELSLPKNKRVSFICWHRPAKSVAFRKGLEGKLKITLNNFEGGELIIITSPFLIVVTHEKKTERDKSCGRDLTSSH
jgi:hypothetical protein